MIFKVEGLGNPGTRIKTNLDNMENKKQLKKRIRKFRDTLKEYLEVCRDIWRARHEYSDTGSFEKKEEELRERLTEEWGRLEPTFKKIGVPLLTVIPAIGYSMMLFDEALSPDFDKPYKGEGLEIAINSATKAIGLVDALSDSEYRRINRKTPNIFLSYSFREDNEVLINQLKEFISSFPISIITGAKASTESISEKVKKLIDDSDFILAVLTKDKEEGEKMFPSKWVFDEIAYALGQKKPIIRLLEDGVYYEPAISGDAEYIKFDRNNMTESFIKLSQTINSFLSS